MYYKKKPVIIEAIQLKSLSYQDITIALKFMGQEVENRTLEDSGHFDDFMYICEKNHGLPISTLEGEMLASVGDYIIKGIDGEFYPCKPEIFRKTYEAYHGR